MFKKAQRKQIKIKMALQGTSGSGKSYSSLLIARGLVGKEGKLAAIDTENGSLSLYSDLDSFDVCPMEPPFTVESYMKAIEAASKQYDALVIDSISHAWVELLEEKARMDSRGGNSFTNWKKITPKQDAFFKCILQSPIHIIATMRSKTDYVIEMNDKGKQAPRKVGLAPVQRDGAEYEFTVLFDMGMDHSAQATKDRTGLFDSKIFIPTIQTGEKIRTWLEGGKAVDPMDEKYDKAETALNMATSVEKLDALLDRVGAVGFPKDKEEKLEELYKKKKEELNGTHE